MLDEKGGRVWFLAIAMGAIVLTPILSLTLPTAIANTLHHSRSHLVLYVTGGTYIFYFIAGLTFFVSMLLMYLFWGGKYTVWISLVFLLISASSIYIASQHYIAFGRDSISYRMLFSSKAYSYEWHEIEKVDYYPGRSSDDKWNYKFTFQDGESLIVTENGHIEMIKNALINLLKDEDIELDYGKP